MTVGDYTTGHPDLGIFLNARGYLAEAGALGLNQFTYRGERYTIEAIQTGQTVQQGMVIQDLLYLNIDPLFPSTFHSDLALELNGQRFLLSEATRAGTEFQWNNHGLTWSEHQSVAVKLTEPHPPNAYGYRTIWTALMTAEENPNLATVFGYNRQTGTFGELTNNLMVDGRDETITIGTPGQPRYPWTGYEISLLVESDAGIALQFDANTFPTADEASGWTLTLGGGVELPFADATNSTAKPHIWNFTHNPGWTGGEQVVVSIRNDEVQNRIGQVNFKSRRSTSSYGSNNIVYGKTHFSYDHEPNGGRFGPADRWELLRLKVTTDKTGDTDPVWTGPHSEPAAPGPPAEPGRAGGKGSSTISTRCSSGGSTTRAA